VVKQVKKIVIAVTGGISAYKVPEVIRNLKRAGFDVRVVVTETALKFVGEATWSAISGNEVITSLWEETGSVAHVDLAKQADLVVIVPATADTISDLAHAKANSAVTALALTTTGPILVFPAMHSQMWEHLGTKENVETLRERGLLVFNPEVGELTSGDIGVGRLPEPINIAQTIINFLEQENQIRVLISAGGTREAIDPVRFITNLSSGKQGVALAKCAVQLGHKVTLVSTENMPGPWKQIKVSSTSQMHQVMLEQLKNHEIVIMAAAVADWMPKEVRANKIKKDQQSLILELVPTVDILHDLSSQGFNEKVFVGFAAETVSEVDQLINIAREKLERKQIDLICANDVSQGRVFGSNITHVHLITKATHRDLGETSKIQAAEEIFRAALEIYQRKSQNL